MAAGKIIFALMEKRFAPSSQNLRSASGLANCIQGTKFMRRLNLGEKEVVRYSVKSGKKIDKLLFEDLRSTKSSKQRGVRFDEERYNGND